MAGTITLGSPFGCHIFLLRNQKKARAKRNLYGGFRGFNILIRDSEILHFAFGSEMGLLPAYPSFKAPVKYANCPLNCLDLFSK